MYFDNINIKNKIYLYLIPILLLGVYFINSTKEVQNTSINKKQYKEKRTQLKLIEYFENMTKSNKLILHSLVFNHNTNIKISGNINSIVKFINITYIEYKVLSYEIRVENKKLYMYIKYDTNNNIYIKDKNISKYDLKNPFIKVKTKKRKLSLAIIGQNVIINSKWYKKGDIYKNKRIINIYQNKIEVKGKDGISIIRLFDEK